MAQLVLVQGAQADHLLGKLQGQGMCLPPVQPVKGGQMHPPNQEATEWQELTAQILDEEPQVPADPRFLLQLIQTKSIVDHKVEHHTVP